MKGDLAHDGVQPVLDLAGQEVAALGLGRLGQQALEHQPFAEDRSGLGQRQGGVGQQCALRRGHRLVHGGGQYVEPQCVTDGLRRSLEQIVPLAPDHLPQEQSQVPGHIPGAANIPWAKAANEDGTFKPPDELRSLYESEGITDGQEVIAYCRIGERSSHTWFALKELLGYERVKNYDGSWTEYGSLVGVPVEKG